MKPKLVLAHLIAFLSVISLLTAVVPTHASPTAFTVDSTLDEPALVVGACVSTPSGKCTLRAAIQAANFTAGLDTIILPAGIYSLTISPAGADDAATGDLNITDDLTITGDGADTTIIDGGGLDRVFHLVSGPQLFVGISGVTIRDGKSDTGGGIDSEATGAMTLTAVMVANNVVSATNSFGGGIYNIGSGTLTLISSTVVGNKALRTLVRITYLTFSCARA